MEEEGEGGYKLVEEEVEELIAKVRPTEEGRKDERLLESFALRATKPPGGYLENIADLVYALFRVIQLTQTVEQLSETLNDPDETPSTTMLHAVQRHREVLGDYKRDFLQTRVRSHFLSSGRNLGFSLMRTRQG